MRMREVVVSLIALLITLTSPSEVSAISLTGNIPRDAAAVFLLDSSNSMNTNDREWLAKDSIEQLIYSLPSNWLVGFVSYGNDVTAAEGMVDYRSRKTVAAAMGGVRYSSYTNAGAGLEKAMELLDGTDAAEKTIVLLSDGEILLGSDQGTAQSVARFQACVEAAKAQGIKIHVIDLAGEIAEESSIIVSAATATGGRSYHVPRGERLQAVVDDLLLHQLGVKKSSAALLEADGGLETVSIELPAHNPSKVRVLLTGDGGFQNVKAEFSAGTSRWYSGLRYALLELDAPVSTAADISFQSQAGSEVRIDVFTEYVLEARAQVAYTDSDPDDPDAGVYMRMAELSIVFHEPGNLAQQRLRDALFQGEQVPVLFNGEALTSHIEDGVLHIQREVTEDEALSIDLDLSHLNANLFLTQPLRISLEGPPPLPGTDPRPWIIIGILCLLALLFLILMLLTRRRRVSESAALPVPEYAQQGAETGRYSFSGRLNLYVTRTRSGRDIAPLTYNLFPLPGGKRLTLREVLDSCGVDESFEGADQIQLQAGGGRSLLLTNYSDCTLLQNREIMMKGRTYQFLLNTKIDITFEDEQTELVLQYREVKPSEERRVAPAI